MEREWLDNALMVGMTPDEFWYGDPELFYNYARNYEQQYRLKQQDIWQIGARFCQALQTTPVIPLGVVGKDTLKQLSNYPDCPFVDQFETEEDNSAQMELEKKRFQIKMRNWVNSFNTENN